MRESIYKGNLGMKAYEMRKTDYFTWERFHILPDSEGGSGQRHN